jgi:hypothetical protein
MSLERKDIKSPRLTRLDPDDHERLRIICEEDNQDIGEWVEQLILREIDARIDAARKASSLAQRLEQIGIAGNNRESSGTAGTPARGARR